MTEVGRTLFVNETNVYLMTELGKIKFWHKKSNVDVVTVMRKRRRFNEGGEGTEIALVPDPRTSLFRRDPTYSLQGPEKHFSFFYSFAAKSYRI